MVEELVLVALNKLLKMRLIPVVLVVEDLPLQVVVDRHQQVTLHQLVQLKEKMVEPPLTNLQMLLEQGVEVVLRLLEEMELPDHLVVEELQEMVVMELEYRQLLVVMVFLVEVLDFTLEVAEVVHKKIQYQQKTQELGEKVVEEQVKKEHLVVLLQVELLILEVVVEDPVHQLLVIKVDLVVQA